MDIWLIASKNHPIVDATDVQRLMPVCGLGCHRCPEDDDSNSRLTTMGNDIMDTLQRVFPYRYRVTVAPKSDITCSVCQWSTEKVHSIVHGARNIEEMGRSRNISCQPTECKLKDVKGKGHLTNKNPASAS